VGEIFTLITLKGTPTLNFPSQGAKIEGVGAKIDTWVGNSPNSKKYSLFFPKNPGKIEISNFGFRNLGITQKQASN